MRAAEKDPAEQEELGTQRERECVEEEPRIDMTPGAEINVQDQNGYLLLRLNGYKFLYFVKLMLGVLKDLCGTIGMVICCVILFY